MGSSVETILEIKDLPPGEYAVIVFQDLNGNNELDKSFLGIPTEPVGASNNPSYRFGPPRWEDCKFQMPEGDHSLDITML